MLGSSSRKTITVEKADGGWVLDWNDPREPRVVDQMQVWPSPPEKPTSGREIYTDQKKLLKRITEFLGITPPKPSR